MKASSRALTKLHVLTRFSGCALRSLRTLKARVLHNAHTLDLAYAPRPSLPCVHES